MNQAVVDLLTRTFASGAVPHPGDANSPPRPIALPGFRSAGMSDEQAQEMIGHAAKLLAEAIDYVLGAQFDVLTKVDAAQLRQDAADAPDCTRIVTITTRPNGPEVLQFPLPKHTDSVVIPAQTIKKAAASA